MTGAPAAAAGTAPGHEPLDLHARLRGLLERSAHGEAGSLAARLLPATSAPATAETPPQDGFYWLRVPAWLARSFGLTRSAAGRELLSDLIWIQYCVYGLFRVQDDLVDGEATEARLAVEANHLLVEASRCAARHFDGGSPFWRLFKHTIDATSRAIVRLDRLQRSPDRPPHVELELYADLAACLKIAAAGVTLAADRPEEWRQRLSPALDGVAVAAQIVDDLYDLRDDLAAGRINYVAWYLSRPVFGGTPEAIEAVVASNLATTDRLDQLLATAEALVQSAVDGLGGARCRRTREFFDAYRRGLRALVQRIHGCRADLLAA